MLLQNIGGKGIGENLDQSRDDKQQGPQPDEDRPQEHAPHLVPIVRRGEPVGIFGQLVVALHHQEAESIGHAHRKRKDDQGIEQVIQTAGPAGFRLHGKHFRVHRHGLRLPDDLGKAAGGSGGHVLLHVGLDLDRVVGHRAGRDEIDGQEDDRKQHGRRPMALQGGEGDVLVLGIGFHNQ